MQKGKANPMYKDKGSRRDFGFLRGSIIQRFLAKLHGRSLKSVIDPAFFKHVTETQ